MSDEKPKKPEVKLPRKKSAYEWRIETLEKLRRLEAVSYEYMWTPKKRGGK